MNWKSGIAAPRFLLEWEVKALVVWILWILVFHIYLWFDRQLDFDSYLISDDLQARRHWLHDQVIGDHTLPFGLLSVVSRISISHLYKHLIPPSTNKFGSCRTIFLMELYVTRTVWNRFSSFSRKCTQPCIWANCMRIVRSQSRGAGAAAWGGLLPQTDSSPSRWGSSRCCRRCTSTGKRRSSRMMKTTAAELFCPCGSRWRSYFWSSSSTSHGSWSGGSWGSTPTGYTGSEGLPVGSWYCSWFLESCWNVRLLWEVDLDVAVSVSLLAFRQTHVAKKMEECLWNQPVGFSPLEWTAKISDCNYEKLCSSFIIFSVATLFHSL